MSHEEFNPVLCDSLGEWKGVGDGSGVRGEGTYVYLWLACVDVWQRPNTIL